MNAPEQFWRIHALNVNHVSAYGKSRKKHIFRNVLGVLIYLRIISSEMSTTMQISTN